MARTASEEENTVGMDYTNPVWRQMWLIQLSTMDFSDLQSFRCDGGDDQPHHDVLAEDMEHMADLAVGNTHKSLDGLQFWLQS